MSPTDLKSISWEYYHVIIAVEELCRLFESKQVLSNQCHLFYWKIHLTFCLLSVCYNSVDCCNAETCLEISLLIRSKNSNLISRALKIRSAKTRLQFIYIFDYRLRRIDLGKYIKILEIQNGSGVSCYRIDSLAHLASRRNINWQ